MAEKPARQGRRFFVGRQREADFPRRLARSWTNVLHSQQIILQDAGDSRQARRYALVAACLHPYGYVLEHCGDQIRNASTEDRSRDLDDLLAGQKPFEIVHRVMERVAHGSPNSGAQLIERNVARIRAAVQARRCIAEINGSITSNTRQH